MGAGGLVSRTYLSERLVLKHPFLVRCMSSSLLVCSSVKSSLFLLISLGRGSEICHFKRGNRKGGRFLRIFTFYGVGSSSVLNICSTCGRRLHRVGLSGIGHKRVGFPIIFGSALSDVGLSPAGCSTCLKLKFCRDGVLDLASGSVKDGFFFRCPCGSDHRGTVSGHLQKVTCRKALYSGQSLSGFLCTIYDTPVFVLFSMGGSKVRGACRLVNKCPGCIARRANRCQSTPVDTSGGVSFAVTCTASGCVCLLCSKGGFESTNVSTFGTGIVCRLS